MSNKKRFDPAHTGAMHHNEITQQAVRELHNEAQELRTRYEAAVDSKAIRPIGGFTEFLDRFSKQAPAGTFSASDQMLTALKMFEYVPEIAVYNDAALFADYLTRLERNAEHNQNMLLVISKELHQQALPENKDAVELLNGFLKFCRKAAQSTHQLRVSAAKFQQAAAAEKPGGVDF